MTVFFVGGSPRSGTTLLAQVLSQAQGANPPIQEAQYFTQLIRAYQYGRTEAKDTLKDYFSDDQDFQQFNSDLIERFFQQIKKRFPQTETIVLKDPYLTSFFPAVESVYPDSCFFVSIRDPRDTIASMIEVGRKSNDELKQKLPLFANRDIPGLVAFYKSFYAHVFSNRSARFRKKMAFVKYEYLVQNTDKFLQEISQYTNLVFSDFDSQNMNQGTFTTPPNEEEQPWRTSLQHGKKIESSSIENYKTILSSAEIGEINRLCKPILLKFGYPF